MELLHHASLHDGVDESHFFGQLLGSERIFDGDVLLVVVEQSLESGEGWLGKVGKWVADNTSTLRDKNDIETSLSYKFLDPIM